MRLVLEEIDVDHFWSFVPRRPLAEGEHWLWFGAMNGRDGSTPYYGAAGTSASRIAYMLARGPTSLYIRRTCGERRCVRPSHMRAGKLVRPNRSRSAVRWGEANGNARMSDRQVRELRVLYSRARVSQSRFAAHYGVSQVTISNIVRGVTRRAAGGPIVA